MNLDVRTERASLEKRESEIQRLIRQMKSDQLQKSPVFHKLEQELFELKTRLIVLDNKPN